MLALEKVWNEYNRAQLCTKITQGQSVALSPGTGLLARAAVVLSFMGVGGGSKTLCNNYKK